MTQDTKRTLSGLGVIIAIVTAIVTSGLTFGWWAVYGAFWVVIGLGVLVWIGGLILMLANDIGKSFFPDPINTPVDEQLELPLDG